MPYATLEDVQSRMPQFQLGTQTKPSTIAAQVFLDDTHSQFDGALENLGYVLPITGPKSLAQCREIVCQGVIAKILYARAAAVGTDAAVKSADRAQKQYDHALELLADPKSPIELTDSGRTQDELPKPGIGPLGNFADSEGNEIPPRMAMDEKF